MENINQIICIGNSSEQTELVTEQIAAQYQLPYLGRLKNSEFTSPGCACTTIMKDVDLYRWHELAQAADLIIALDQDVESYDNRESWQKTQIGSRWYAHFKPVIRQNQNLDLYITRTITPLRPFNSQEITVTTSNQDLVEQLFKHDVKDRRVILEFMRLDNDQSLSDFLSMIDSAVEYCRKSNAKFIMLRADQHEEQDIHYEINYHFCQYPEFLLLNPKYFTQNFNLNLNLAIDRQWNKLYCNYKRPTR
jgi:hypothetical protein